MTQDSLEQDVNFLYEMGSFRFVERTWRQYFRGDLENNAEHTFRVAWIALLLAKYEGISDQGKILRMALIHDIAEGRTGDVHIISRLYTKRNESGAFRDIFSGTVLADECIALWDEYEARETLEAKIVKDADTLDVDLEIMEQSDANQILAENFKQTRRENVYPKLLTQSARRFFEKIYVTNPSQWVLNSKNRFNSGDLQKD